MSVVITVCSKEFFSVEKKLRCLVLVRPISFLAICLA